MIAKSEISFWNITDANWKDRWSKRVLTKVQRNKELFLSKIRMEIRESSSIPIDFWPLYRRTVFQKDNYELTSDSVKKYIERISSDNSYKLIWFVSVDGSTIFGGHVIHVLPNMAKGVYRAYDHEATKIYGYSDFDYYADYLVQEYVNGLGLEIFSRGAMTHPCRGLGLSLFKLKTGAYPKVPMLSSDVKYDDVSISAYVHEFGVCAIYSDPDESGRFHALYLYYNDNCSSDLISAMVKLCERINISVVLGKKG